MRILIAGTDGFIGGALRRHLVAAGHCVHGTTFWRAPGPDETRVDLTADDDLARLPGERFDVVINATGIVDQTAPARRMRAVNADGVARLLGWARAAGCGHLIQLSSVSVAGPRTLGRERTEARTRRYRGPFAVPYMRTKSRAEQLVQDGGLPYTILRLPPVIGARDSFFSAALIPELTAGTIFTCGAGDRLLTLLSVENLGPIVDRLLARGPRDELFNCGCHDVPWSEVVGQYARELGVAYRPRRVSRLSILTHLGDKRYLLVATYSAFGSHFPSGKLFAAIGELPLAPWQDGVRDAVTAYDTTFSR